MKKVCLLLAVIGVSATLASAQSFSEIKFKGLGRCAFNDVLQKVHYPYETAMQDYEKIVAEAKPLSKVAKSTGLVYDIPVVFHIVYDSGNPDFNLHDTIIQNQIDVLNRAFRKQHADTVNTRAIFKPLSADAEIQFHLATKDPDGKPTTGITRTITSRAYFGSVIADDPNALDSLDRIKKTAMGGIDPWPATKYLNIWVGNLSDDKGGLEVLGYAIPPLSPVPSHWPASSGSDYSSLIDGVVIQPHAVGSNNSLSAQLNGLYTKGRAVVHEVGHYLGLMHIFGGTDGSSSADCGTANASDGIHDTPEQGTLSASKEGTCPSDTKNSCSSGTADLPDMWENYMDYANDACQTMFTNGQIAILRSVMANQRNSLTTGTASVASFSSRKEISVYPNPANNTISISYEGTINNIKVINFIGGLVLQLEGADAAKGNYNISNLPTGNYIWKAETKEGETLIGKFTTIK